MSVHHDDFEKQHILQQTHNKSFGAHFENNMKYHSPPCYNPKYETYIAQKKKANNEKKKANNEKNKANNEKIKNDAFHNLAIVL